MKINIINNTTTIQIEAEVVKKQLESSKHGSFNLFVRLNNKIGIKFNTSKKIRDANYARQEEASKIGLGPDVYGYFDVTMEDTILYGYLTEIVTVLGPEMTEEEEELFWELRNEESDKLSEIFPWFRDNHEYNVGIKNGKLVCIDFDSLNGEHTNIYSVTKVLEQYGYNPHCV